MRDSEAARSPAEHGRGVVFGTREAAPPPTVIETRGLCKYFGAARALDGLELDVRRGEFLTLFGPNGAGKTTLVRILATLSRASSGTVRLFGLPPGRGSHDVRRRLGVVSHRSFLYGSLTARQNLRFYARMFDVPGADERACALLEEVGLGRRMDDPVSGFSRGMEQRCAIARALLHEPELLLFDEPFSGLDPDAADRLRELLGRMHDGSRSLLLTSHDLARGAEIADSVAILAAGRVVYREPRTKIESADLPEIYRSVTRARRTFRRRRRTAPDRAPTP